MSKVHEDNAGHVGVSYEETQDPYYSYNKLSLPLGESDKSVIREEVTHTVTQANSKFVIDGTSQKAVPLAEGGVYTFDQSDASNQSHPLRFSEYDDGTHGDKFGIFNGTDARYLRGDGNTILAGSDPFTVEAWIKPNTNVIIGLFDGTSGQAGGVRNYGNNTFAVQGHESTGAVVPTSAIKVGQWQHIAVSYRVNTGVGSAMRMDIWVHIDGERVATGYRDGGRYTVRPTFDIGTINAGGDGKFNGLIRNFRVTPYLVYPDISFTPPAFTSTPATTSISVSSQSKTWGQLNSGGATGSFAEVNPQYIPFTLPSNYDCVDFATSPYPPTGASFTVVFGATGASFDAYYLDLSDNWQSLGTGLSNSANTTRTFTPSTRFKVIRLYSTTGNLGNLEVVNAYNSYDAQNARVSTLNAGLTNTVSGGVALTNNNVVLGPIEYTTGVTATGTPGQAGAQTKIVVPFGAPDLYYYCSQHSGMGGSAVTPENRFMFQAALPIYKTADRLGTAVTTASAVTTGLEYAVNTNGSHFDDSGTTLNAPDVTGYTYSTWSGSQDESALASYGANSIHVLRAADGKARTWHVSTDTSDRYLWTSGDGIKWASKGGLYDTDGSTQTVISKYLGWAGGSNSSTTSVSASPVPEVAGDPYGAYLSLAVPMHGVHNGMTFPDHADELNPNLSGRTLFNSGGYTRNTHPANYYGTSGYFSSGNDFLTIPCDSSTAFAEGEDFTIEFWMAHPGTFGTGSIHPSILTLAPLQIYRNSNGNIALYDGGDKAAFTYDEDPNWNHFAWVRRNGVVYGYLNGRLQAQTSFNDSTGRSSGDGYIGKYPGGAGLGGAYLSDFRIYKGIAKYTSNFDVPNQVDNQDLSGNGNNAIIAGASWQTSVKKFYGGAVEFEGGQDENAADRIEISQGLTFDTDFTLEFWAYPLSLTNYDTLFDCWQNQTAGTGFYLWVQSNGAVDILKDSSNYYQQTFMSAGSLSVHNWSHIAIVRSGNVLTGYSNGSPRGTYTVVDNWTSTKCWLGSGTGNGTMGAFNGYFQDFKHYGGIAKYTSPFTSPERSVRSTARRYPSGIYVVS